MWSLLSGATAAECTVLFLTTSSSYWEERLLPAALAPALPVAGAEAAKSKLMCLDRRSLVLARIWSMPPPSIPDKAFIMSFPSTNRNRM